MEQNKDRKIISTNTRYPVELRESLLRLAKKQKRSFNAEVMWALQMYVEQQEAKGKS
jgi:predicted HicB family RNase H-like nuclease